MAFMHSSLSLSLSRIIKIMFGQHAISEQLNQLRTGLLRSKSGAMAGSLGVGGKRLDIFTYYSVLSRTISMGGFSY